jgi:hypothetical protein
VPTRKQRRRRQKEKRHEYEYVFVDDEGNEVEPPPEAAPPPEKDAKPSANGTTPAAKKGAVVRDAKGRKLREPRKPSWSRSIKLAALVAVVLFAALSFTGGKKKPPLSQRIGLPLFYAVAGTPIFYWMDKSIYRRYQRAAGKLPEPASKRGKRSS